MCDVILVFQSDASMLWHGI